MNNDPVQSMWVWVDLEMTGLKPETNRILEIATVITDLQLNVVALGPNLAIYQSPEILGHMDAWCQNTHQKSGLLTRVQESKLTEREAEAQTLEFLKQHLPGGQSPMCGNTICMDRRFLYKHMPNLEAFFHYRHIDVSTMKELFRAWAPNVFAKVKKEGAHLAQDDILESIAELKIYYEHLRSKGAI